MSGGHYDHFWFQVDEVSTELKEYDDPLRQAFADHLRLISKALKDIEWVDSGDRSPGDEYEAIRATINNYKAIAAAIEEHDRSQTALRDSLEPTD